MERGREEMEMITSRSNPLCTHLRKLSASGAYRRRCGEFLCDSPKLLTEALACLLYTSDAADE